MADPYSALVPDLAQLFLERDDAPLHPALTTLNGVVFVADLSGFTALASEQARLGALGAEHVQQLVNRVFGPVVDAVHDFGGEVISFPGDAVIAMWPKLEAAHAAACAADAAQQALRRNEKDAVHPITMRVVLGAGELWAAIVGGVPEQWHFLVGGAPFQSLARNIELCSPGDIVVDAGIADRLHDVASLVPLGGAFRLARIGLPALEAPRTTTLRSAQLHSFVPSSVRQRIDSGHLSWLAEIRLVTTVMLEVVGIDPASPDLDTLQQAVTALQRVVNRFGGYLNQIVNDDKGLIAVVAFGTAGHAHEDNPIRALSAAVEVSDLLAQQSLACKVGITTAQVFSGVRGSKDRFEPAVIGHAVNLAARLMQAAEQTLCDRATFDRARRRFLFEARHRIRVKGLSHTVAVYTPLGMKEPRTGGARLLGRKTERSVIDALVSRLVRSQQGGVLLVEGAPGVGKTVLLEHVLDRTQATTLRVLRSQADSIESATPLFVWRRIVADTLDLGARPDPESVRARLLELLDDAEAESISLLNPVLPIALPESSTVQRISGAGRAQETRRLLAALLERVAAQAPILLMIEDVHWIDEASLRVVLTIHERLPNVLIVLSQRLESPFGEDLRALPNIQLIRLTELDRMDTIALMSRRLDVEAVPEELANFVYQRSGGHPLFVEQLATALRDRAEVIIEGGECSLARNADLEHFHVPDSVASVVMSTVDRLSVDQQLLLKVGSVLGMTFSRRELLEVLPVPRPPEGITDDLEAIRAREFVTGTDQRLEFRHALIRQAIYDVLPISQRRALHLAFAELIEAENRDDLSRVYALLAFHLEQAGKPERAIHFLDLAGTQALERDYANVHAIDFFTRVIALDRKTPVSGDTTRLRLSRGVRTSAIDIRRAHWHRALGDALLQQGRPKEAVANFEKALDYLGQKFPLPAWSKTVLIARRLTRRLLVPPRALEARTKTPTERAAIIETVATYERYTRACYTLGRSLDGIASSLQALPLAERLGPSYEYCNEYGMVANIIAVSGRRSLADRYAELAFQAAVEIGDPAAEAASRSRGILYRFSDGDDDVQEHLARAIEIYEDIGNFGEAAQSLLVLGRIAFSGGRYAESMALQERSLQRAEQAESQGQAVWTMVNMADVMYRWGRYERALELCAEATERADQARGMDHGTRFQCEGIRALIALRDDRMSDAWSHAASSLQAMDRGGWLTFFPHSGYMAVFEILLHELRHRELGIGRPDRLFGTAMKRMVRYQRYRGMVRPLMFLYQGRRAHQLGRVTRAARLLHNGATVAAHLRMPFELALLKLAMAETESLSGSSVSQEQARALFNSIDAIGELRAMSVESPSPEQYATPASRQPL